MISIVLHMYTYHSQFTIKLMSRAHNHNLLYFLSLIILVAYHCLMHNMLPSISSMSYILVRLKTLIKLENTFMVPIVSHVYTLACYILPLSIHHQTHVLRS